MSRLALVVALVGFGALGGGVLAPGAARADMAAATTCAGSLDANARMVFDATAPKVTPGVVIKDALRAVVRPMVMDGKLSRGDARVAAEAAGHCLAMING